jgi:hypothetical protein
MVPDSGEPRVVAPAAGRTCIWYWHGPESGKRGLDAGTPRVIHHSIHIMTIGNIVFGAVMQLALCPRCVN